MLTEVRIPVRPHGSSAYAKVDRRAGDWAVVAAGAAVWLDGRRDRRRPGRARRGRPQHHRHPRDLRGAPGPAARRGGLGRGRPDRRRAAARRSPTAAAPPTTSATSPTSSPGARCARPPSGSGAGRAMRVSITVNDELVTREVEARLLLVHFLRDELGLTGTHWGCDTSNCGACVDPVRRRAGQVLHGAGRDGRRPRRAHRRGPRAGRRPRPGAAGVHGVPRAPVRLLHARDADVGPRAARPRPAPHRPGRSARRSPGQICRCTGYATIVRSVQWAAEHPTRREEPS